MGSVAFTYQSHHAGASMTLFAKEDIGSEDYSLLEKRIGAFSSLYLAFTHHIHPKGHKETKEEIATRENFFMERFVLIAAEFDNQGVTGYASAFFVFKENPKVGYVMELSGFQITDCVYGTWEIKDDDGDIFAMEEVLDFFDVPVEGIKEGTPIASIRREEEAPPAFVPTKKRVIQNLGTSIRLQDEEEEDDDEDDEVPQINVPRMEFVANSAKKPGKIHLNSDVKPRKKSLEPKPVPVQEEEEEEVVPVEVERADFVANSSEKPSKIRLDSDVKKKKKVVREPKEDAVIPTVTITPDFTPTKKAPIGTITQNAYKAEAELFFPFGPKNPMARLFIYFPDDPYVQGIFDEAAHRLSRRQGLSVAEDCLFSPEVPNDADWKKPLEAFDLSSWRVLALTIDLHDAPISYLLGHASIKGFAVVLDEKGVVVGVSFNGIDIRRPHFSYAELLSAHGVSSPEGE